MKMKQRIITRGIAPLTYLLKPTNDKLLTYLLKPNKNKQTIHKLTQFHSSNLVNPIWLSLALPLVT